MPLHEHGSHTVKKLTNNTAVFLLRKRALKKKAVLAFHAAPADAAQRPAVTLSVFEVVDRFRGIYNEVNAHGAELELGAMTA